MRFGSRHIASLALLAALPAAARASVIEMFNITATDAAGTGTWHASVTVDPMVPLTDYTLASPITLRTSGGTSVGTLKSLWFEADQDPGVSLKFAVSAGSSDTRFTLTSPVVSFAPITNPDAFTSAGLTLTDNDSTGAAASGNLPSGEIFQAQINGGSKWCDLLSNFTAPTDASVTESDRNPQPAPATMTIPGTVSDISSTYQFTVSANDDASGTSRFSVTPEPGSLSLVAVGAAGLLLRRRK